MRNLIPVKDHPDLARDKNTGMIVNINKVKHKQHMQIMNSRREERQELENLRGEVKELKLMLTKLLESGTNA